MFIAYRVECKSQRLSTILECVFCGRNLALHKRDAKNWKSCGCQRYALIGRAKTIHGHYRNHVATRTRKSWEHMIFRCTNPGFKEWRYYGGRGITVCDRWHGPGGFENFLADMGERPEGTTLDRFPNTNGDYEPANCRWATPKEQRHNSRQTCRYIAVDGITLCVRDWTRRLGISPGAFYCKYRKTGSMEQTVRHYLDKRGGDGDV
jgi:hypothetical protein